MIRQLWPLGIGFTIWTLAFVGLYALQHLGCHMAWPAPWHRVALGVVHATAIGILTGTLLLQIAMARKPESAALGRIGVAATAAALGATVVTFAPTIVASPCL